MKKNYVLLLIAALCVILSACTKEGVYNPKEKISRIFYQSSNSNGKNLQESWTWDKNLLSKIVDENGDFRNFEYDGKQLKTVRYSNGDKLEYTYPLNFCHLSAIVFFSSSVILLTLSCVSCKQ